MNASARRSPARPLRRGLGVVLLLSALCLALAPSAPGGAVAVSLHSYVSKADTVGVRIDMGGFPYENCSAEITKGGVSAAAPAVRTGGGGGARWSWLVPGNLSGGRWRFSVACSGGQGVQRASTTFPVAAGIGPHAAGLWVPGTMRHRAISLSGPAEGNGGGGGSLYPPDQCTAWVAKKRPDLPYFSHASGDALNWAKSAAAVGFPVGDVPVPGAVAVFQPGQYGAGPYGHVAYVLAVGATTMTISESNFQGRAVHDRRTIGFSGLSFIYRRGRSGGGSSIPGVQLRTPSAGAIVSGTVALSAASDAPGIRFQAYYYSNPSARASAHLVTIADDRTQADGFSAGWDTSTIPNQGGPGGSSVLVTALALDAQGNPTGALDSARVNVANSHSESGVTFFPYYVVGTCEEGECGLHLRTGPGYSEYAITGERFDGEELDLVCQAHGEGFTSPSTGNSSDIWDRLTDGDWVTDYYVDTPNRGVPSPPLPLCS